jgi:hypothetical protein
METDEVKRILENLSDREKVVVGRFGDRAKDELAKKLKDGYTIHELGHNSVQVKKGFSYFEISSGGSCYSI